MERAIDKLILYICAVFVLWRTLTGLTRILAVYLTLAVAAAVLWLIPKEKRADTESGERDVKLLAAYAIMDASAALILFEPGIAAALPLLVYDLFYSRHLPGLIISGMAYINTLYFHIEKGESSGLFLGFTTMVIFLAVWLSYKTVRLASGERQIRKLRDDDEEQRQKLNRQNEQLLEAKDSEVVTAQLEERNRIAREIHDNVGHTLSRALLQVGALLAIHKEEPVHTELSGVRETLDNAMTSIRSSVHDLHDSSVDLESTVRQIAEPLQGSFSVTLETDVSEDMSRELKYGMIGILREAVSNILRHSRNDTVQISILEHPGFYQLIVHDYLSPGGKKRSQPVTGKENSTPGIGLSNIEGRVRTMGGTVRITGDDGFRIFVSVPK